MFLQLKVTHTADIVKQGELVFPDSTQQMTTCQTIVETNNA